MTSKTRSALGTEQTANFADNTSGAITPAILRSTTQDMIDSTGTLLDANAWTGSVMSFSGSVSVTGALFVGSAASTIFNSSCTHNVALLITSTASSTFNSSVTVNSSILVGSAQTVVFNSSIIANAGVSSSIVSFFSGGLVGSATNDSATAGNIGEEIESSILVASAQTLLTGSTHSITNIAVTAGDWDISGSVTYQTSTSTSITNAFASISSVSTALDLTNGHISGQVMNALVAGATSNAIMMPLTPTRWSFASTTTIFLLTQAAFTAGGLFGYGIIRARRLR